jgi:hypothetical protein
MKIYIPILILCSLSLRAMEAKSSENQSNDYINSDHHSGAAVAGLKGKIRIQNYSEFMSPALSGSSIPGPRGERLAPALIDSRIWMDYKLTHKLRMFYWQRYFIFPFNDYSIYDPRIGLRLTDLIGIQGISTTYDIYILPGLSKLADAAGRYFEVGFRTNTAYRLPESRWDLGFVSELNASFYRSGMQGKSVWGVLAPYVSYTLSQKFSTQHWFMFPVKYENETLGWDVTGMPFVQNGIGWAASNEIWLGVFLNNYLATKPSLENSWVSVWLNLTAF